MALKEKKELYDLWENIKQSNVRLFGVPKEKAISL